MPQSAAIGSLTQQKVPHLKVEDLEAAKEDLESLHRMSPIINFARLKSSVASAKVVTFSDVSFNISQKISYGHTGQITGVILLMSFVAPEKEHRYRILV